MSPVYYRERWTTEDMDKLIKRSVQLLKGTETLTDRNVANTAAMRSTRIGKTDVERYLAGLSRDKRLELGFPDSNQKPEKVSTRPTQNSRRSNWRVS